VCHVTWLNAARLNVPQFFYADAVALRIDVVEFSVGYQLFGQRTARAFGKHRDFCVQFVAGRVVVFGLAVFVEALVSVMTPATPWPSYTSSAPPNSLKTFTPAASTNPPSHFTILFSETT